MCAAITLSSPLLPACPSASVSVCNPCQERDGIEGLHASLFSSSTGELKALDLAPDVSDTLWAASMVNSRCFSDAAGRELLSLMVPLADMANHSNEPNGPNAGYRLDPGAGTFSVTSTKVGRLGCCLAATE
jgi:hypothetical protein